MIVSEYVYLCTIKLNAMGRNVEFNEDETVKKAMNVFWEKGYNGTSMQDLVDAMQINRSSLYNTIGDKQQLFLKCIDSYADGILCETITKAKNEKSPLKALVRIINDAVDSTIHGDKGCLGTKTIFEMGAVDKTVCNALKKSNDTYLDIIIALIKDAMAANEIDASEDPEMIADYIMTSFTGWKQSFILQGDPIKIKKMSEYLIKNITHR